MKKNKNVNRFVIYHNTHNFLLTTLSMGMNLKTSYGVFILHLRNWNYTINVLVKEN